VAISCYNLFSASKAIARLPLRYLACFLVFTDSNVIVAVQRVNLLGINFRYQVGCKVCGKL